MSVICSQCGASIEKNATKCENCGAIVVQTVPQPAVDPRANLPAKSRIGAALLAFFLGSFGAHKFYLGRVVAGIFYLLFCLTFIPFMLSILYFATLLCMSDENFCKKYKCRLG